jgi:hypothetical protein
MKKTLPLTNVLDGMQVLGMRILDLPKDRATS